MDPTPEDVTRLIARLNALEERVFLLEHPSEVPGGFPTPAPLEIPTPHHVESSPVADAGATFSVFGKAMLGIAGAYLLRAVAESGSFPKLGVVALAIAYAVLWMVWAARVPATQRLASTTYAATSALILAPMLWELTLRFNILSPTSAACALGAFVLAAYALAWKRNLVSIVWVAVLTTALTAIALLIATRAMLPFLAVLLLMALLSEIASSRNRWMNVRPIVAIAADIAVWALLYVYSNPGTSRADYARLSVPALVVPSLILLILYGISAALRTTLLRQRITLFEAAQVLIAFLLAAGAMLRFGSGEEASLFAVFCLLLAPACYAAVFLRFDPISASRNQQVYATWGLVLILAGSFLCLPTFWLSSCLGAAAIVTTFLDVRRSRPALGFHGLLYLVAAASVSGLSQYAAHALAGAFPEPAAGIAWIVAVSAVVCYAIGGQLQGNDRIQRLYRTLSAALAIGALATFLVSALVWLTGAVITPGESLVAVIRTFTACALALALAYFGPRWPRVELVWVSYATLALVAAKLLFEDLRQGHPKFIAASIFLYAVTLIVVPRILRNSSEQLPGPSPTHE
ncbi:MAG: hypothetical protein ABR971_02600 [Acidobacteriaceae bacterium]